MQGMQGPRGDGGSSGVLRSFGQQTMREYQVMCPLEISPRKPKDKSLRGLTNEGIEPLDLQG
jgi:hypothetical protein